MVSTSSVKIQAFLAHAGIASRRASEKIVEAGNVKVNGQLATIGQRVTEADIVEVDGKTITHQEPIKKYFLVYKPIGYVSTTSDELGRPTVLSLLPPQNERLYPVGRLDIDSEGLILITNDGELANKLTHPRYEIEKTYRVTVYGTPTDKALDHLSRGVRLKEGYTNPAIIEHLHQDGDTTTLDITITQGWNRQVRRMCERVGYDVAKLVRIRFGQFSLKDLAEQRWKAVTI